MPWRPSDADGWPGQSGGVGTNRLQAAEKIETNRCKAARERKPCIAGWRRRRGGREFSARLLRPLCARCSIPPEFQRPAPQRLIGDGNAALQQHLLHRAKGQGKASSLSTADHRPCGLLATGINGVASRSDGMKSGNDAAYRAGAPRFDRYRPRNRGEWHRS